MADTSAACPTCEAELPTRARFCPACGAPTLGAGRAAPAPGREGRKVITALFVDVVGSTAIGERLDPEDYRAVIGEALERIVPAVEEYGGTVRDLAGDGVLALFGAPMAHEDDAERAALAGLRILAAIRGYADEVEKRWGIERFSVRVGIETGLAVLGPVGGGDTVELGAMGDVLNTAARIQSSADPGSALVGPLARRLIEPLFEWGEARRLELKGKADPLTAYPLLAAAPERADRTASSGARLVGREGELALAQEALGDLHEGQGGVLIVAGEAGIGKTRLLDEMRALFESAGPPDGGAWLQTRCASYGESVPFGALGGLLRDWPDVAGRGSADERAAAVRELLLALSRKGALVVALDDLQWSDAATLRLLERVLGCTEEAPILIVLAMRAELGRGSGRLAEAARRELPQRTRAIGIQPLRDDADRGLLAELTGGQELPDVLEGELLSRAGGNPFFLEELVRSLTDSDALHGAGPQLPQTIERVILARVDRMSASARELTGAASVLGREFDLPLLEEVRGAGPATEALDELVRADLVRESGEGPARSYGFRHQLVQEAVYGSLLKERRRELHARAAEALERRPSAGAGERAGVIAFHFAAAQQSARAFDWYGRAADAAYRIGAGEETASHCDGALAAAEAMTERPDPARIRELRHKRGLAMATSGRVEQGLAELQEVVEEAREAGDRREQMLALADFGTLHKIHDLGRSIVLQEEALAIAEQLGDRSAEARALSGLSLCYANQVQLDRGLSVSRRALELGHAAEDREAVELALDGLKLNLLGIGDLTELERVCDELESTLRDGGNLVNLSWALLEGAFVHIGRAEWERAEGRLGEAIALNRRLGDRLGEPLFLDAICWMRRARGELGPALAAGREAHALARDGDFPYWQAWTAATLGWTLTECSVADEAAAVLAEGCEVAERAGVNDQALRCTAELARAQLVMGARDRALETAERGEALLAQVSAPPGEVFLFGAHAYLALAEVRLAAGQPDRAREIAAPVLEAALRHGWVESIAAAERVLARASLPAAHR